MANVPSFPLGPLQSPVTTSPVPNGPGGNTIVQQPAHPGDWWKMLLATGVGAIGIYTVSVIGGDEAAKWLAVLTLLGIITWYETHNNQAFSHGINAVLEAIR